MSDSLIEFASLHHEFVHSFLRYLFKNDILPFIGVNHTRYSIDTYLLWFDCDPDTFHLVGIWHSTMLFSTSSSWLPGRAVFYAGWLSHERQTWQIPHEREAQDTGWSTTRRFGRNIYFFYTEIDEYWITCYLYCQKCALVWGQHFFRYTLED